MEKKKTSVVSIRLPNASIEHFKRAAKNQGVSLNKQLSAILLRDELDEKLKTLSQEEVEFIDKIYFWQWLCDNMGSENVERMMLVFKEVELKNKEDDR